MRLANETLARELTISLSAFLRMSVTATHTSGQEISFGEFPVADSKACFGLAVVRPGDRKLVLVVEYSVLLPLVGVALGAKAGSFGAVDRKPTEIELQVVSLLYRMILSDAYRSWATLMETPLETVTLEFEPAPSRILPATEPVFAARFDLAAGEQVGQLTLLVPPDLFATVVAEEEPAARREAGNQRLGRGYFGPAAGRPGCDAGMAGRVRNAAGRSFAAQRRADRAVGPSGGTQGDLHAEWGFQLSAGRS